MQANPLFVEVGYNSLNKKEEELCGDKVEVFQSDQRTIIVLADGLGSGVKANILSTLTSKIAITMLKKGATIEEVIDTIAHTLPVCKVRKIAYSTFSILEIDEDLNCKIFESENPPFFFLREGKILQPKKQECIIMDKKIMLTEVKLKEGDHIYLCSDGVIHAGVGQVLNFGWQWEHVANYIEKRHDSNAESLSRRLLQACNELYEGKPGDDTTVVTVKIRKPVQLLLFSGPPADPMYDGEVIQKFFRQKGKKVVCGGTAANIVSRELKKEIKTQIDYMDPDIPPTAFIDGIDLVTEGVLTIQRTIQLIRKFHQKELQENDIGKDGASQLFRMLVEDSTHVDLWLGKAMNTAHQKHGFPKELSIKANLIQELKEVLVEIGKVATIHHVSEVYDEEV
ncbi:MAG: serine/threonine-protein phosphatase [Vallitaleaceae bacterium]|nr:serine/threonine-protein phosphatase [Vallitaleaceae bacterium]